MVLCTDYEIAIQKGYFSLNPAPLYEIVHITMTLLVLDIKMFFKKIFNLSKNWYLFIEKSFIWTFIIIAMLEFA